MHSFFFLGQVQKHDLYWCHRCGPAIISNISKASRSQCLAIKLHRCSHGAQSSNILQFYMNRDWKTINSLWYYWWVSSKCGNWALNQSLECHGHKEQLQHFWRCHIKISSPDPTALTLLPYIGLKWLRFVSFKPMTKKLWLGQRLVKDWLYKSSTRCMVDGWPIQLFQMERHPQAGYELGKKFQKKMTFLGFVSYFQWENTYIILPKSCSGQNWGNATMYTILWSN